MDRYLQRALTAMNEATRDMSEAEMSRAAKGKWSIANIVEHLARAFEATHKGLRRRLADESPPLPPASLRQRLFTLVVVELGQIPNGRKAPELTLPAGISGASALQKFRENLALMDVTIGECAGRFGREKIGSHPLLGPFSADQWRRFHWVHTRHHVRQILALRGSSKRNAA